MSDVRPAHQRIAGDDAAAFLAQVPIFAALPFHARAALADATEWIHLPGGTFLFHQGDEADDFALVWSGRLEVLDEATTPATVVGHLGRGGWVGELSLLTGAPRSLGVRAVRDGVLVLVPAPAFHAVLEAEPGLALTLARALARQLQASQTAPAGPTEPDTICVLPLGAGLPLDRFLARLTHALAAWGPVAVTGDDGAVWQSDGPNLGAVRHGRDGRDGRGGADADGSDGDDGDDDGAGAHEHHRRWAQRLDQLEAEHPWVVLVSTDPAASPTWASFCVRSADRVLALARGGRPPAWAVDLLGDGGADAVFVGSGLQPARVATTLGALRPRALHHLPEGPGFDAGADRVARRASGRALGLVLSGGGARGLAHLGVLERLLAAGVTVDRVGGCSAGAFAAGLLAMGTTPSEMLAICREELVERHPFLDVTLPREGLIRGRRAMAMLTRVFGDTRIEELSISLFAVSADLATGELVVHRRGLVRDAVAASMSIPGFAPPVARDGRLLVDGGLLDNLPVDVMRADGEGPVVAVDVMRRFPIPDPREPAGLSGRPSRRLWRELTGPGIVSTMARSMVLGGWQRAEQNRRDADLLIAPEVDDIGLFEFDRLDDAVEAGRRAADAAVLAGLPG